MDQHPVPQNITGYQFRLVGDMTLRQFGMLASGAILAIMFYYSPFPGFFKYPFVGLFSLLGLALAFLPVNDMPLDRWLVAFIRSIYSPTRFYWKKTSRIPDFLAYEPAQNRNYIPPTIPQPQTGRLSEYIGTLAPAESSVMDKAEADLLSGFSQLLQAPAATSGTTHSRPQPVPPTKEPPASSFPPPKVYAQSSVGPAYRGEEAIATNVSPVSSGRTGQSTTTSAKFSTEIPFPSAPETPNMVVGMVLSPEGKIIENAMIEVRDTSGQTARALKTNKLGQFLIANPLKSGIYEIEVEKEGFSFDIIKFEARGEIILPIEIRAKSILN